MKKIAIITDRKRIAESIEADLRFVFQDTVEIQSLTFKDTEKYEKICADAYLFTLGNRIKRVMNKLEQNKSILVVRRTIKEKELLRILQIPKNTKVLVVNDNYENTIQTVSLLYELNIDNVMFIPYKEGETDLSINIAVTPGEVEKVPKYIKNVIDIGDRCLDLPTFMELTYRLGINDDEISKRIYKYTNLIVNSSEGIKKQYKDVAIKNAQMNSVIEMSEQGILMCLTDGEIVLHNKRLIDLLDVEIIEGKTNIRDIFNTEIVNILNKTHLNNEIIKINERDLVVKKNTIVYDEGIYQDLFLFSDITYVNSLEQTILGHAKSKGFVAKYTLEDMIHSSKVMNECIENIKIFAKTNETILIQGESGTGKELVAQSIHNLSDRSYHPFVAINCAALPASLLESELFGYEKGSFTGASKIGKIGLFESANTGTIFLDEIGDMSYELQSRLLRVIQEKQIMKIGSEKVIDIDVRIIAATNKNLREEVEKGNFRKDLYYRLDVLPLSIPPLRERREDIIPIFKTFVSKNRKITNEVSQMLIEYNWPGNIRELKNAAGYFELMDGRNNCLPDYIVKRKAEFDNESLEKEILKIIYHKNKLGENIGREKILEQTNRYIRISEYRLRNILLGLEKRGLIIISTGRKGTIITEQGIKIIR